MSACLVTVKVLGLRYIAWFDTASVNISPPFDVTGLHLNNWGKVNVIVIKNNIRHLLLPSVFIVEFEMWS